MNEQTVVKTMALPFGQKWLYHADANVLVLSEALDEQGREDALSDMQAAWRRSGMRVVTAERPAHSGAA